MCTYERCRLFTADLIQESSAEIGLGRMTRERKHHREGALLASVHLISSSCIITHPFKSPFHLPVTFLPIVISSYAPFRHRVLNSPHQHLDSKAIRATSNHSTHRVHIRDHIFCATAPLAAEATFDKSLGTYSRVETRWWV